MRNVALICLGAALGAFAAVPALHLIDHHDDHVHINGAVVHLDDLHEEDHHGDEDAPSPPLDHGKGSLAHFGTASLEAPAPLEPTPIIQTTELSLGTELAHLHRQTTTHRARAPP